MLLVDVVPDLAREVQEGGASVGRVKEALGPLREVSVHEAERRHDCLPLLDVPGEVELTN